jgi:hypothetical protein
MSERPDLFAPPARPLRPLPPPFDPYSHPCAVCGAANAPFGVDYPRAPQFYCRGHREEERRDILAGDADRGS